MFESFLGGYKYYLQLLNTWPPYNCRMSTELAKQSPQLLSSNNSLAPIGDLSLLVKFVEI